MQFFTFYGSIRTSDRRHNLFQSLSHFLSLSSVVIQLLLSAPIAFLNHIFCPCQFFYQLSTFVNQSEYLSVHMLVCVSICACLCKCLYLNLLACVSIFVSACLCVYLCVCLSVCLSMCMLVSVCICVLTSLSLCLSLYMFVCSSISCPSARSPPQFSASFDWN